MAEVIEIQDLEVRQKNLLGRFDEFNGKQSVIHKDLVEIKDSLKEMKEKCDVIAKKLQILLGIEDKETKIGVAVENSKEASPINNESVSVDKIGVNINGKSILDSLPGGNQDVGSNGEIFINKTPDLNMGYCGSSSTYSNFKISRLDFPCFDGGDVCGWIRQATSGR
ncbi:hypothetical protein AQUCO_02500199v1 [Aquilegia coerulea]|uniref:Uncharacterized protein n=1 Tax=Aquilegia coerulea TaxID=218851 RepID=A0A2G5D9X7_AQUCA|nr:hypothetical protein AQUCO_02500199v1 [Aquilegia coerulea]